MLEYTIPKVLSLAYNLFRTSCLRGAIAIASPSQDFIKHSFRLNCIFKLFDIHLLTESKFVYNLGTL
jgi:hypothetical protein